MSADSRLPVDATVEVIYALPDEQTSVKVPMSPGMTAAEAVAESGLAARYPVIRDEPLVLGIWGVEVDGAEPVAPGDRVEITRPLVADPRDMRRELLGEGRVMGGARVADAGITKKGGA